MIKEEKMRKKLTKKEAGIAVISVFVAIGMVLFKEWLAGLCAKTNSPLIIFLDIHLSAWVLCIAFFVIFFILCNFNGVSSFLKDLKEDIDNPFYRVVFVILLIIIMLPNFFHMSNAYGGIKIDSKEPLKVKYSYCLYCDWIKKETDSVVLAPDEVRLDTHQYTVSSGRGGRSHVYTAHYISFKGFSVYLYEIPAENYIRTCQKYERDMRIVYYKNSGIIKTIDGIKLYDEAGFDDAISRIESEEAEVQAQEEQVKKEEKDKELALFSAFFNSEGDNYEDIVRELEREGIENTYDVEYISTKYFDIGEVAFFDNGQDVVYVVRDNDGEDMVKIPPLPLDGTLPEITKILDENGIKWTYDCFGSIDLDQENLDHSKDTLNTVHCSPGTPIPKDYVFWFSVTHVE